MEKKEDNPIKNSEGVTEYSRNATYTDTDEKVRIYSILLKFP
jgi:hypothetical protein